MKRDKKVNVMVLMGGASSEHEVSLASGQQVVSNLNPKKFNIMPMVISKDGKNWNFLPTSKFLKSRNIVSNDNHSLVVREKNSSIDSLKDKKIDVVFIAMHGSFGEDGKIQGLLELMGIKYTGSGVLASAIGMDKLMFRNLLKSKKILFPKSVALRRNEPWEKVTKEVGKPPYFVKPSDQGSSVGMSIIKNINDVKKALNLAFKFSDNVLVDEYVKGREFTCAVLGNDELVSLPVIEIIPKKAAFFDYKSKYSDGGAEEIVPAKISKELSKKIQKLAIEVYKLVGCKGFGRVDFIVRDNEIFVLEINTIPGLTQASLLPKAAKAQDISYSDLVEKIVNLALK